MIDGLANEITFGAAARSDAASDALAVSGGGLAGMRPIATPMAATGFSPRSLSVLSDRFGPLGLTPMAGGAASAQVIRDEGDKPLVPGAPLSIAHGDRRLRPLRDRHRHAR